MKVRVTMDVTINGDREEVHPNFAARLIDSGLCRIAETSNLLGSWETVDVEVLNYAGR